MAFTKQIIAVFVLLCTLNAYAYNLEDYEKTVLSIARNPSLVLEYEKSVEKLLEAEPNYFNYSPFKNGLMKGFKCPTIPPSPSEVTSVHKLRPSDVKVVAAMGDSLTAGVGVVAKTVLGLLFENRGRSWSVGGKSNLEEIVTMPNILKNYSPDVEGVSTRNDFLLLPKNKRNFNVAVSGNEANHLPGQARELLRRIRADKSVDFEKDWKIVTLFIGGNDLCDFCKNLDLYSPQSFVGFIQEALDILHNELPRTFVNLVTIFHATEIQKLNKGAVCVLLHKFVCPCAGFYDPERDVLLKEYNAQYVNLTHNLINSNRYDTREDFTVVIQPFMEDMEIPETASGDVDLTYFAPDCFHFSTKGQSQTGVELWNAMFTPVSQKSTTWNLNQDITCPTQDAPYLYTRKNSF